MKTTSQLQGKYWYTAFTGLALMNFSLFIHPSDPLDFIILACSNPLQTIAEAYGIQAAILFWISAAILFIGLFGLVRCSNFILKLESPMLGARPHVPQAKA